MPNAIDTGLTSVDEGGKAVSTGITFVEYPGNGNKCGCDCGCDGKPMYFRSVWDRLIQQLFGAPPVGMNSEEQLPDIKIWKDGVELVGDTYPYTFHVTTTAGVSPRPYDVVLYNGRYYVIGAVDE